MKKPERGFSLIEIMVSLLLSSLIMAILMQHYLSVKRQYIQAGNSLEKSAELQMVTELIRDSTRRAGFTPCANISRLISRDSRNGLTGLSGISTDGSGLRFSRMYEYFSPASRQNVRQLLVEADLVFETGQAVLIADCFHAEVQKIRAISKTDKGLLLSLEQPLHFDYSAAMYLGAWLEERFFIKENALGQRALFYQTDRAEELTGLVNQLTASLAKQKNSVVLKVILGLTKGEPLVLETRTRST